MSQMTYPPQDRELLAQIVSTTNFQKLMKVPKFAWQEIALIAGVYASIIMTISLYLNGLLPLWLAIFVNAAAIYAAFTPFHDAAHSSASGDRKINDLMGTISVLPLFPGFTTGLYRFLHLEHHRYTGEEDRDPDDMMVTAPAWWRPLMWTFVDVYWVYWYLRRWKERSPSELIRDAGGLAFFAAVHVGFLTSEYAYEFIVLWLIPQRLGMTFLAYLFASIQHPAGVIQAEHPIQGTRMIKGGPLMRYISLSQSQHLMHHLFPAVPFYRYNAAWNASRSMLEKDNEIVWSSPVGKLAMPNSLSEKPDQKLIQKAHITKIDQVSPEVRAYTMRSADAGKPLAPYTPGGHIDVHLSPTLVRQYSLCRAPQADNHEYRIAIKREMDGRGGSIAAHAQLQMGAEVEIGQPRNHFELFKSASGRTILVSGGIGITPLISMAETLAESKCKFILHACARSEELMPFAQELQGTEWASESLRFHFDNADQDQRISPEDIGPWSQGDLLYICGPAGFMEYISQMAETLGWPTEAIRTENFSAGTQDTSEHRAFEVVLNKSGLSLSVPAEKSLLEVLQESKVSEAVGVCTQGICGSCKVRVLSGRVEHHDVVLSPGERDAGYMTACVSRSVGDDKLSLDL